MSIVENTGTTLVIQFKPWLESLVGVLFAAAGAWAFFAGERVFGGGFFVAGAVLILVFANVVTCRFDRTAGRFTRSTRGPVRRSDISHALEEITDVRVQASSSAGSPSKSYRVVLGLQSGARVPIGSGYTSGKADKERLASAIRRFLNLPDVADPPTPGFLDLIKQIRP